MGDEEVSVLLPDVQDVGARDQILDEEVAVFVETAAHLFYGCVFGRGEQTSELFFSNGAFNALDSKALWFISGCPCCYWCHVEDELKPDRVNVLS